MDARSAEAQKLPQRRITAALFDHAGRIRLSRRALGETGGHVWDFSAQGAVLAGEAREDAAARLLEEQLGLSGLQPVPRAELPPQVTGGAQWVSLFVAGRRGAHLERIQGAGMFLDKDERTGLAEHFPELLSPGLLYCIKSGLL